MFVFCYCLLAVVVYRVTLVVKQWRRCIVQLFTAFKLKQRVQVSVFTTCPVIGGLRCFRTNRQPVVTHAHTECALATTYQAKKNCSFSNLRLCMFMQYSR